MGDVVMPQPRAPRWTQSEIAVLEEFYPSQGVDCVEYLPGRTWKSVHQKAFKLGLRCEKPIVTPAAKLAGDALEQAIVLREAEGWSFARIGAKFGISEAAACNAVLIALCPRKGFRPAERDDHGRLLPEGIARLRYALKKGLKGCDIQLRLGLSAGRIAEERRRYDRELKAHGKAELPAPGGGERYSGVKLDAAAKREVEALFMQGLGTSKIHERTGVSHTSITRIRTRLVRRLRRKGEVLPGCDAAGKRHQQAESLHFVPDECRRVLRAMLLDGMSVRQAAYLSVVGDCSAYRMRDELAAELEAQGKALPQQVRLTRAKAAQYRSDPHWPPEGLRQIIAFRALLAEHGTFEAAKDAWRMQRREERQEERARPRSFDEQLERIGRGEIGLTTAIPRAHLDTTMIRPEARTQ